MSDRPQYSDEDLTAYLDGELDAAVAKDIENAVASDDALSDRLDHLSIDTSRIAQSFDEVLANAPETPAFLSEDQAPVLPGRRHMLGSIAATAVLSLLAGSQIGYLLGDKKDETWREFVATYQALYINSTLVHIDQPAAASTAELKRVGGIVGKEIELPQLTGQDALDYKRAQILGFEGRPLMQLTFLSKVGAPVALCIMRSEAHEIKGMRVADMQGMSSAAWSKDGFEYLLIGGQDEGLISNLAAHFAKVL